ncbi:uncharacterized protein [Typha latifolia]|uniref:uncharacterized protein n=1 Tax=Typha latifolia TaxID=4733 RepID=UPI003C2C50CA
MAITHDDLSLKRASRSTDISSRLAVFLVVLSIVCGLSSFILCLAAEASRSEATWYLLSIRGNGSKVAECFYNSSGQTPLACAVCAFLLLAVAMFAEHAYMLVAVASPTPPSTLVAWTVTDDPRMPSSSRTLTWQSCFLFLTTWVCFAIAEVLLMIGIGVESGHLSGWDKPRAGCHVIRPGMFAAAGILGLITVFLGFALYLTALRTQRLHQEEGNIRRGPPNLPHHHRFPPSAPREPQVAGALHGQPPQQDPAINKTSTSSA